MATVNNSQNETIPESAELSIITESVIIKPEENKDIKFEEVISNIMSEPKLSEQIITESIIQEPVVNEDKTQEIIIPESKPQEPKIEIDHPMVEVQNKVQEVIDVINTHVASKTDEAAIEIIKDTINEVSNDYVKDKIIIPFEKVALLASKMSHDALSNLEQYAINGNHWWNSVWWIKIKAQMFVAIIYVLVGIVLGSYVTTKYYEYRMDQNTELLSAMIYKGKIYDLKVRLQ